MMPVRVDVSASVACETEVTFSHPTNIDCVLVVSVPIWRFARSARVRDMQCSNIPSSDSPAATPGSTCASWMRDQRSPPAFLVHGAMAPVENARILPHTPSVGKM